MTNDAGKAMTDDAENEDGRRRSSWRVAAWTAAALVLLPLVAMQLTDGVDWSLSDFISAAVLLLTVGIPLELAVRKTGDTAYRWAAGLALATAFLNGAVGIIGADGDPANLMYFGVLTVGIIGALIARFRPRGMARAMFATALAQASVAVGAVVAGLGLPWSPPAEILAVNSLFIALWAGSAVLFREAARGEPNRSAV